MVVGDTFVENVRKVCGDLNNMPEKSSAHGTLYSGVYVFPLSGAVRILSQMNTCGIMRNVDDQINNKNKSYNATRRFSVSSANMLSLINKTKSFDEHELHNLTLRNRND